MVDFEMWWIKMKLDVMDSQSMDWTGSTMYGSASDDGLDGLDNGRLGGRAMYGSASHDGLDGLGDGTARQARRCTMDWKGSAMGRLGNGRLGVRDVWLGVTRWIGRARKRTAQRSAMNGSALHVDWTCINAVCELALFAVFLSRFS